MRALALNDYGGPEVLQTMDLPEPTPGDYDLLVEVHATALNPVDFKIRQSGLGIDRPKPVVLGFDVCGKVVGVGARCSRFREGDIIYASPSVGRNGANAEYVLVDERTAAVKPESLSIEQAAALPLVTLTAWESLHKRTAVHPGETVFIQGGAGGVGHVALQLCRQHGNPTITTASRPESIELCQRCGAGHVLNYREEDVVGRVMELSGKAGVPVAFDCVGDAAFEQCLDVLAVNGRVVGIVMTRTDTVFEKLFRKNATLHLEFMGIPPIYGIDIESHGEILQTAGELADAGKLEPHVQEVIALDQVPDAHRQLEEGHTTGKIVVRVKE